MSVSTSATPCRRVGPFATYEEAAAACNSSASSSSAGGCCDALLPFTFAGSWASTAGIGSPQSGSLTFTYATSGAYGAGWYSDTWQTGTGGCLDTYYAFYRCVTDPITGLSSYGMLLHAEPGPYQQELGYTGSGGVWTNNGPLGECTGTEQTVTIPYGGDCEEIGSVGGGGDGGGGMSRSDADIVLPMAARPATFTPAAVVVRRGIPDRFPLPLCKYEGAVSEYAGCGCEDKHIRFCELPGQGDNGIPEIDRMTRAYLPDFDMPNCEKCNYRKAPGDV